MVKLYYTQPALNDLKAIYHFIALDSPASAKRFLRLLKEKIKILKTHPLTGKVIYPDKFDNIRPILYQSYRIIYRFDNYTILNITIHHQSRLIENISSLDDYNI